MRIFTKGSKTNFVDEADVLVGLDSYQGCCESFGYFFTGDEPTQDTIESIEDSVEHGAIVESSWSDDEEKEKTTPEGDAEAAELHGFFFDPTYCKEYKDTDEGGYAVFRLVHKRLETDLKTRLRERNGGPVMYLVLYNHHNGYYSHGFTCEVGGAALHSGAL